MRVANCPSLPKVLFSKNVYKFLNQIVFAGWLIELKQSANWQDLSVIYSYRLAVNRAKIIKSRYPNFAKFLYLLAMCYIYSWDPDTAAHPHLDIFWSVGLHYDLVLQYSQESYRNMFNKMTYGLQQCVRVASYTSSLYLTQSTKPMNIEEKMNQLMDIVHNVPRILNKKTEKCWAQINNDFEIGT